MSVELSLRPRSQAHRCHVSCLGHPRSQLLLALSRPLLPVPGPEPAERPPRPLGSLSSIWAWPAGGTEGQRGRSQGICPPFCSGRHLRLWLQFSQIPCFLWGLGLGPSRHPCSSLCVAVAGVRVACHLCPPLQLVRHLRGRFCLFPFAEFRDAGCFPGGTNMVCGLGV